MSAESTDADTIWLHSHVSGRDGHPYVVMDWGTLSTQWTVEEVIAHALALLECAYSAQSDSLVLKVLGGDGPAAAAMLSRMRQLRGSAPAASTKRSTKVRRRKGEDGE